MDHIPGSFIDDADNPAALETFLKASKTAVTHDMNATRVEAEVYLARTLGNAPERIGSSLDSLAQKTEDAMQAHAAALITAAKASDRYARSLSCATWALVAVTVALALLAIVQLMRV